MAARQDGFRGVLEQGGGTRKLRAQAVGDLAEPPERGPRSGGANSLVTPMATTVA